MYQEFYKLSKNPFQLTPDPEIFFLSKEHQKVLSYLRYGLGRGEGFVVITGDIGTGKTTIVKNLISELDTEEYITGHLENTFLQENELIEVVCKAFGLNVKGYNKGALLNLFNDFLIASHQSGFKVILMIDEVHNLPFKTVEEVRMLSNFQIGNRPLLQSFLVGQGEFAKLLKSPKMEQLQQRVVASWHLGALTLEETKNYISFRLKKSGSDNKAFFDDDALVLIYELSDGIPRRINVFCDRLFLFGYIEEIHFFTCEHIKAVTDELENEVISPVKQKQSVFEKSPDIENIAPETPAVDNFITEHAKTVRIKHHIKENKIKKKRMRKKKIREKNNELPKLFISF